MSAKKNEKTNNTAKNNNSSSSNGSNGVTTRLQALQAELYDEQANLRADADPEKLAEMMALESQARDQATTPAAAADNSLHVPDDARIDVLGPRGPMVPVRCGGRDVMVEDTQYYARQQADAAQRRAAGN